MKWNEKSGTRIAGTLFVFSVVFALLTVAAIAGGYFGGDHRIGSLLVDIHYVVLNSVLLAAATTLLVGYHFRRNPVLLDSGLAIGSWLLAHVYWTMYVYLGGTPITYPSVAELGFQGFHLGSIPLSLYLLRAADIRFYRPSSPLIVILATVPALTPIWLDIPIHTVVYSTWYLALIGGSLLLAAHFLRHHYVPLFGAGLALFSVTEGVYVGATLFNSTSALSFLDPLWYVGAALIAFALFTYDDAGALPDPSVDWSDTAVEEPEGDAA